MLEFNPDNIIAITTEGKQWRDKVNGNSYWSSRITLTDGDFRTRTVLLEYQYGYGGQWIQDSLAILRELRYIDEPTQPTSAGVWSGGRRVVWNAFMQTGCSKRDVKCWGKDD